jgi:nucleotide-binding universal stress UspA family protein
MRNVLVAYDGSQPSKRALEYVINRVRDSARPIEVHVINAQHGAVIYGDYVTSSMMDEISNALLVEADKVLQEAAAELTSADVAHKLHPALGNVAEQVNAAIKQLGCDTVVMGTRGLGSFGGLLLGSVANRVIHEVTVPVVLIK